MIPEITQRKLSMLQQAADDAHALAQAAKRQVTEAERRLALKVGRASEADIERTLDEHERALNLQQQRYKAWQDAEGLMTRLNGWVRELPRGTQLEIVPVPIPAFAGTETNGAPAHVVGTLRSAIAKLASQHHAIRTAPAPLDDAKRQVRAFVSGLAAKGRPNLTTQFGQLVVHGWSPDQVTGPIPFPVVVEFMAWLDPERVVSALERELEKVPVDPHALPYDQRASRLAEIEDEIGLLEAREEYLIERAAKDGVTIPRRDDASPAAILQVRVAAATARAAA